MSTVNTGNNLIKTSLTFDLDPTVSAGFIKTPNQISNCITWFDADDLTTITTESGGRNVRYWADKSNSNLVLTGGGLTLSKEPLSVLAGMNGGNTMRFDGGDYISGTFNTSYTEFTIFLVMRGDITTTSYQYPFSINNGTNTNNFHFDVNDPDGSGFAKTLWVYWNSGGTPYSVLPLTSPNTTSDFLQGSPTLLTFSHTNAGGGSNIIYVNGRQRTDQSNAGTQTITIGGSGFNLYMGAYGTTPSGPYTGDICELIIYSRQLSATERYQVQNYLANKWRIPLLQTTLTNRDLIFNKLMTCQNNNIPVIDKSYRVNPANATGSPLQSNFYLNNVSYMSSVITYTITLEAWVKPNSFTFYGSPGNDLGTIMIANSNFYLSIDGNGKFNIYLVGATTSTPSHLPSTTSVTRNTWNHVVITFDGAYIRWYLNGVLDKTSSTTYTLGVLTLTNNLGVGSEGAATFGRFLDGYVAGCKVYGRALPDADVLQNYEQTKNTYANLPSDVTGNLHFYMDADVYSSYIGTGTSWNDLSGNGYNSTLTGGPTFISTDPKSFNFNGNYSLLPANTANGYNGDALTVEVWVKHNSFGGVGTGRSYVSNWSSFNVNNQRGFILRTYDTQTYPSFWWCWGGGNYYAEGPSSYVMQTGKIYHIVATYEKNVAMKIYINGNLELTTTNYTSNTILFDTSNGTHIGYSPINTSYMDGNIYLARVYNRVLSAANVLQNYNSQKYRFGK